MTGVGDFERAHTPRVTRRTALGLGAGALLAGSGSAWWLTRPDGPPDLYSETVALTSPTTRELVPVGETSRIYPRSRVLRSAPGSQRLNSLQQQWISSAAPWTRNTGAYDDLAHSALADIHALTSGLPATVAGWTPLWRYIWPRDSSATAVALATAGRPDEAISTLRYLQKVQAFDGWFEARYVPGTGATPDGRERQLDGSGWVLWATDRVWRTLPVAQGDALVKSLRPMITRSLNRILSSTNTSDHLPTPSPDYWEVEADAVTLGTVAPLLAGLEAAPQLLQILEERELAAKVRDRRDELAAAIDTTFGDHGYPREAGGSKPDSAIAFILPPFVTAATKGALATLDTAGTEMLRPAGGLAPGAGWKDDGISWTPETAAFALASAANGDPKTAKERLNWLAAHRTAAGSFPEKVLADGSPAAVAPLSWTAAFVLLALHELYATPAG